MKIYGVPDGSPLGNLIAEIEAECVVRGQNFSRWQGAGDYWSPKITYIVHVGVRPTQHNLMNPEMVRATIKLSKKEGYGKSGVAFVELTKLLGIVKSLPQTTFLL